MTRPTSGEASRWEVFTLDGVCPLAGPRRSANDVTGSGPRQGHLNVWRGRRARGPRRQQRLRGRERAGPSERSWAGLLRSALPERAQPMNLPLPERSRAEQSRAAPPLPSPPAAVSLPPAPLYQFVMSRKKAQPAGLSWKPRSRWNSPMSTSLSVVPRQLNFCISSASKSTSIPSMAPGPASPAPARPLALGPGPPVSRRRCRLLTAWGGKGSERVVRRARRRRGRHHAA